MTKECDSIGWKSYVRRILHICLCGTTPQADATQYLNDDQQQFPGISTLNLIHSDFPLA